MCQVHLIYKLGTKKITKNELQEFDKLMRAGASSNRDSYGFFTDKRTHKNGVDYTEEKTDTLMPVYNQIMKDNSQFIVGHNRFATKGTEKENKNNHPFETDQFIIVHNGVLRNDDELKKDNKLEYDEQTDSAVVIHLLEKFMNKNTKVETAIKKVAEMLEGSFSILIYHKPTKRMFYIKDRSTDFYFAYVQTRDGDVIMGSTKDDNLKDAYTKDYMIFHLDQPDVRKVIVEAEKEKIYEITNKEIKVIGKFEEKISYSCTSTYDDGTWENGRWVIKTKKKEEEIAAEDVAALMGVAESLATEIETVYGIRTEPVANTKLKYVEFTTKENVSNMPRGDLGDLPVRKTKSGKIIADFDDLDLYIDYDPAEKDDYDDDEIAYNKAYGKDYNTIQF